MSHTRYDRHTLVRWGYFSNSKYGIAQALVEKAVQGKQKAVEAAINAYPEFLVVKNTFPVPDHVQHEYEDVTVFEAALMTDDTDMCNALIPYFEWLYKGRHEILKQMIYVFAEKDFDMKSLENKTKDGLSTLARNTLISHREKQYANGLSFKKTLDALVIAITNATEDHLKAQLKHEDNGSELNNTVLAFRKEFEALSQSERVYNKNYLIQALTAYKYLTQHASSGSQAKVDLFWRQVIGYIQRSYVM